MQYYRLVFLMVFAVFIQLIAFFGFAVADTQYVTDMLILTLRDRPSDDCEVIGTLKTNDPVEVLEERGRYLMIRTREGKQGWVAKQYITSNKPKPFLIAELQKKVSALSAKIEELEEARGLALHQPKATKEDHATQVETFKNKINEKETQISRLSSELKQITDKYNRLPEQSKNVIALVSERDDLQTKIQTVTAENDRLQKDIETLKKKNEPTKRGGLLLWFLTGAGVFFVGLIAGKTLRKKRIFY